MRTAYLEEEKYFLDRNRNQFTPVFYDPHLKNNFEAVIKRKDYQVRSMEFTKELDKIWKYDPKRILRKNVQEEFKSIIKGMQKEKLDEPSMIDNIRLLSLIPKKLGLTEENRDKIRNKVEDLLQFVIDNLPAESNTNKFARNDLYYHKQNRIPLSGVSDLFFQQANKKFTKGIRNSQIAFLESFEKKTQGARDEILQALKAKNLSMNRNSIETNNINSVKLRNALLNEYCAINYLAWDLMRESRWTSSPSRLEIVLLKKKKEIEDTYKSMFGNEISPPINPEFNLDTMSDFYGKANNPDITPSIKDALKNINKWDKEINIIDFFMKFNSVWDKLEAKHNKPKKKP